MQKQLEGTQKYDGILGSADRVAHIDGQLLLILAGNTTLPAV